MRRRTAVLLALLAGVGLLALSALTWIQATGLDGLSGTTVDVSGAQASTVVSAMALVGMASGAALSIARRVGVVVIGVLLVLTGIAAAWASLQAGLDPEAAARGVVGQATGTTAAAGDYLVSAWPWVAAAAGAVLALTGVAVLAFGSSWRRSARRFDSPTPAQSAADEASTPASEPVDEMDAWDELTRGQDPT